MSRFRVSLGVVGALAGTMLFAGSAPAGAFFDVPLTPGHFRTSDDFVFAGVFDSGGDQASVAVQNGILAFRPKAGGPIIHSGNGNTVMVGISTPDGANAFGCWMVTTTPVTISSELNATLSFDSSASNVSPCPGFPVSSALTAAAPQLSNLDEGPGFNGPVQVTMQWMPNQPLDVTHSVLNQTCQDWTSLEQQTRSSAYAVANGTISASFTAFNFQTGSLESGSVNGTFTTGSSGMGQVSTDLDDEVVNGPASGTCGPYGVPPPPGV